MENNNDDMSLFDSDLELNFDYESENDYNKSDDDDLDKDDENIKPIDEEDDSQESVDGDEDESEGDSDDDDSSPNLYSSFSTVLYEQGIIPSLDSSTKIETIDDLAEAIKKEIELQYDSRLSETLNNLDLEKIANSKKEIFELEQVNEDYLKDNLEVAKKMIYQDYLNQGLSEDRATKLLRKTIDLGEDMIIEDALESKESLQLFNKKIEDFELEQYKQNKLEETRQQQKVESSIKNFIYNSKEVIQGVPNTKVLQDKVFKNMTEVVIKNPETGEMMNQLMADRSKNPLEFDTRMYYLYTMTNGFKDLGTVQKSVTSSTVKNLEKVLRKTKWEDNGTPSYLDDPESYGGIGSELVM
jgi:hypothetical protein